jgi:hypothetical protein
VEALLGHPLVEVGAAPLLAGLLAALVLHPLRLGGLAAACGFFAAVYLIGRLDFDRKLLLVAAAAPLLGALVDLAFRPARSAGVVLGIVFGLAAFWVFIDVFGYMRAQRLVLYALGITVLTAATVAFSLLSHAEPLRAGPAGLALALGTAGSTWLAGIHGAWALSAGAAGFVLVSLFLGKRLAAGASFTLSVGVIAALLAGVAVLRGGFAWYYAALLAIVPLAVRLPVPQRSHPAAQAAVALLYALLAAGAVCVWVWTSR